MGRKQSIQSVNYIECGTPTSFFYGLVQKKIGECVTQAVGMSPKKAVVDFEDGAWASVYF